MDIPKDSEFFRVWFTTKAGKTVFEGYVLGKENKASNTLDIFTFIYDPKLVINKLIEENGELQMTYFEVS